MAKPFKTLDEQVEYLEKNKLIAFDDKLSAKKFLLKNNYFNVVSTAKIILCTGYENGKHSYKHTNFKFWEMYYLVEQELSFKLLENVYSFEKIVNSQLAYYLSLMIHDKVLNSGELERVRKMINKTKYNDKKYSYDETWVYVTKFMFSETIKMMELLIDISKERSHGAPIIDSYVAKINSSGMKIKKMKELKNLRNNISHNTPLSVYLTAGGNLTVFEKRKKVVEDMSKKLDKTTDNFLNGTLFAQVNQYLVNKKTQTT